MSFINLYSDTQSVPTPAMRQAMAEAEVGDEQAGLDPTVDRLCEKAATLLGKERAVFLPSGTMCNAIAILVHCRPGDEVIAHESAHIINYEGGGPAVLAGVMVRPLTGARGQYESDSLRAAIRPVSRYHPKSSLVAIEQTANLGGGSVWPLARIEEVAGVAREAGLKLHMDGARLLNAAVASNVSAADFAGPFDSVWLDLSKGLGCPVGAVLAGSAEFIEQAWQWKQRLGGAMRQAGIIAAAGVHALDHHVARLAEDHANARLFADLVADHPALELTPDGVDTNIVFLDYKANGHAAGDVAARAMEKGLRIGATNPTRFRVLTYIGIGEQEVREGARIFREVLDELG
jgi:threonine aldolase